MRTLLGLVFLTGLAATGCGPYCNSSNVCAVDGEANEMFSVCDGSSFIQCGDGNRGQQIACPATNKIAECSAQGWSFSATTQPSSTSN